MELKIGGTIKLTIDKAYEDKGTVDCIYVDYTNIVSVIQEGDRIFVDDGLMSLICREKCTYMFFNSD